MSESATVSGFLLTIVSVDQLGVARSTRGLTYVLYRDGKSYSAVLSEEIRRLISF